MSTPPVGIEPTALQRTTVFKTALHANWRSTAYPTVSGLEPLQRFHAYLRFSKPLPYQLGLHRHSKPTKWVRQGFGTNPDQRRRVDSNHHTGFPDYSPPSKRMPCQLGLQRHFYIFKPFTGVTRFELIIPASKTGALTVWRYPYTGATGFEPVLVVLETTVLAVDTIRLF